MKMTLTSRGPRGPSGTVGHTLRTAALQENIVKVFRDPVFAPSCCHSHSVGCTTGALLMHVRKGREKSRREHSPCVLLTLLTAPIVSLCVTVSTVP